MRREAGPRQDRSTVIGRPITSPLERKKMLMAWTTPILIEIRIGLEINGYLPAEF